MNTRFFFEDEREQFRLLVESAQDYAIFLINREGRITSWNPGVRNILQFEEAEFVGEHVCRIFTPEDREQGVHEAELTTAAAEGTAPDERWHLRKDGSRFWASGVMHALRDEAGNLRGFAKILRDFTQQKQTEARLKEALEKERQVAETLQRSLLLTSPEDAFMGLSVKTFYEPAMRDIGVGGDFYDFFPVQENKIAVVVGDVTGKGLSAAASTAEIKYTLRAFLRERPHPSESLARLNHSLCESQHWARELTGQLVALSLAVIDTATGEAQFTAAGAEPPLLLGVTEVQEIEIQGMLLGIDPDQEYDLLTVNMAPGDTLVMLTDGFTEARSPRKEFLGYEGVKNLAVRFLSSGSLIAFGQALLSSTRAFAGGSLQDDASLVLARRL